MAEGEKQRLRNLAINVSISLAALLLSFAVLEVVARYWESSMAQGPLGWDLVASRRIEVEPSDDPRINAVLRPDRDFLWEGVPVHINSKGLRDDERDYEKKPGVFRVLILGDSVAFGWEIRLEDTYGKLLEKRLQRQGGPKIEVINAGIPGWDLPIEAAYLERHGVSYAPDLIIGELTVQNDIYRTVYQIPPPSLKGWLRGHTYTWGFLSATMAGLRSFLGRWIGGEGPSESSAEAHGYPFPLDETDPLWDEAVRIPLLRMAELAKKVGAPLVIVVVPTDSQVRYLPRGYPTTAQSIVRALGLAGGFTVVDPLPSFIAKYEEIGLDANNRNAVYADEVSHPSALGHRLIADAIERSLPPSLLDGK